MIAKFFSAISISLIVTIIGVFSVSDYWHHEIIKRGYGERCNNGNFAFKGECE